MSVFQRSIKWVMLVSGVVTCTTAYVVFCPATLLHSEFGIPTTSAMALVVVRHWGALVGVFGLMLIYGAFKEHVRRLVLLAAAAGKAIFILLVFSQGQQFGLSLGGPGILLDTITVLLFAAYLISGRKQVAA